MKLAGLLAGLMLTVSAAGAAAQSYPTRTVTLISPYAAGGSADLKARALAEVLQDQWKVTVVVENRIGGGTVIATNALIAAPADGYTIMSVGPTYVINPGIKKSLPYDTLKDLSVLTLSGAVPFVLAMAKSFPANSLAEAVDEARKREAKPLSYATSGVGSGNHMMAELLQKDAGIKLTHVPYPGSAQAMSDVLSGRVDWIFDAYASVHQFVESGQMKVLATATPERHSDIPKIPTVAETYPGFAVVSGTHVVMRSAVPIEIQKKASEDIRAAVKSPRFKELLAKLGETPLANPPALEETNALVRTEVAKWTRIAKEAGISVD